jgi:hypothetical protein
MYLAIRICRHSRRERKEMKREIFKEPESCTEKAKEVLPLP